MDASAADASALTLRQAAQLLLACGVLGVAAYLLLLASFALLPTIRAQHPAAGLVAWQAGCGLMTSLGFVAAFFAQVRLLQRLPARLPVCSACSGGGCVCGGVLSLASGD